MTLIHEGNVQSWLPKDVGQGVVTSCLPSGVDAFQIQGATTFPPDRNGVSGRMRVTFTAAGATIVEFCRVVFERIDVANPAVPGCP